MGVIFDLTVTGPEILDAVIFMDKSPAYAAFKEEIEKILADFNKNSKFGQNMEIDVKNLVESSSDAVKNMHRAFLIWTFNEDKVNNAEETKYETYLKLFFKAQEKNLVALNGGKKTIAANEVVAFKEKYIAEIGKNSELFNSLKEFFAGYIYGYFFNYLTEQEVMRDYAEFIVCLGIMSNKITTSETAKQKILPKMAILLNNDRFKYIGGEIPLDVMMEQVYDRFSFTNLTEEEEADIKGTLEACIMDAYAYNEADNLINDDVMVNVMSKFNKEYICASTFAADLQRSTFDGTRVFLDADKNDMGEFTVAKVTEIVSDKCASNHDPYYTSEREAILEFGLGKDMKGYQYPLTFKSGDEYWFTDIYKVVIAPACDKAIYIDVDKADLPLAMFPFAENALNTNIIRVFGSLGSDGYTIRSDKRDVLIEINALNGAKNLSEVDKKMKALEKLLYVISGNLDAGSYQKLLNENVFGTKLYDDYIRYRMDCIFSKGMKDLETKKTLLDELNKIG